MSQSPDTRSLLQGVPRSYDAVNDEQNAHTETPPVNKFSRADTFLILAGLWSGVFLGAFDGQSNPAPMVVSME